MPNHKTNWELTPENLRCDESQGTLHWLDGDPPVRQQPENSPLERGQLLFLDCQRAAP